MRGGEQRAAGESAERAARCRTGAADARDGARRQEAAPEARREDCACVGALPPRTPLLGTPPRHEERVRQARLLRMASPDAGDALEKDSRDGDATPHIGIRFVNRVKSGIMRLSGSTPPDQEAPVAQTENAQESVVEDMHAERRRRIAARDVQRRGAQQAESLVKRAQRFQRESVKKKKADEREQEHLASSLGQRGWTCSNIRASPMRREATGRQA